MRHSITSFLKVFTLGLLISPVLLASVPAEQVQAAKTKKEAKVQTQAESQSQTVNINKASAESLEALPGIGPALASRIITYREENGPFKTVDDITEVRGIGAKMLAKLRPYLSL